MKKTALKHLIFLTLITYIFFFGCVKQDSTNSIKTVETTKVMHSNYGHHTDEIEEFLSASPLGSEIYLEKKETGDWYLKIEKTFTTIKYEEKTEIIESMYGESILI
ncbi:MAG: Unknown protein [uncultured Sulfurovum sp.]|uniref:Lipoprotein n=1 Tax=uncultured Sulfurovum sp. TaxID=269237 RepID=A0A6S6TNM4_9BACT|nr:MAG: Unknown protein [uncultured Sulfurovum sp.]